MRIQHNIMAMNAYRNYTNNTSALSANLEKLSSGYKINRAGDDAAGLAISEKMRAQITGLNKAQDNAKDGISLVQTAEGALTEVHDMLNRMYELAEQSANGTYDGTDRTQLQKEVNNLRTEINRIADSANFNGINLLDGSMSDVTTHEISIEASVAGIQAGLDAQIAVGSWETSTGTAGSVNINFVAVTQNADVQAEGKIDATGGVLTVTISLNVTEDYSATDIQKLLNGMTVDDSAIAAGASQELLDAVAAAKEAIKGATVVGKGVTGMGGATAFAGNTAAADMTRTPPVAGQNDPLTLQIGDTSDDFNQLKVAIKDTHADALGIDELDISTQDGAADALDMIKAAINYVSDVRGTLGATQNRLDHTINNLSVMEENIQDAESTIRDTDVAEEMMAYTKNNILIQSAQAMLAQANQVPQGVLQLLQ